jgi:hypothetical protein
MNSQNERICEIEGAVPIGEPKLPSFWHSESLFSAYVG